MGFELTTDLWEIRHSTGESNFRFGKQICISLDELVLQWNHDKQDNLKSELKALLLLQSHIIEMEDRNICNKHMIR